MPWEHALPFLARTPVEIPLNLQFRWILKLLPAVQLQAGWALRLSHYQ
jgi:hypothetical protein